VRYAYYPGCSLETSSRAYDLSVRQVAQKLGIELEELEDWNCCGATEFHSQEQLTALAVSARNLALVDPSLDQLIAPCAACYLNLKKTDYLMAHDPPLAAKVKEALAAGGLSYTPGRVRVRHLLDVICLDLGEAAVRQRVVQPLTALRLAPYYGCQIVRPYADFDNSEHPTTLDNLLTWIGAEVLPYPLKTHCCGGHLPQISETQAFELIRRLLQTAVNHGADMIVCMCPMCQLNLDAYQSQINRHYGTALHVPVVFFTQVLGLAFGIQPRELGFGREIVRAEEILRERLGEAFQSTAR